MKYLEMVYLMKVVLHLETMNDIKQFEQINKKCSTAITTLKINPWFIESKDIEEFCEIFRPTTCNCNSKTVKNDILLTAEKIRNFDGHGSSIFSQSELSANEKEVLVQIFSKIESVKFYYKIGNEQIKLFIQNMPPKINIFCNEEFLELFEYEFENQQVPFDYYPKRIIVDSFGYQFDTFLGIKNAEHKNIIIIINNQVNQNQANKILCGVPFKKYMHDINYCFLENDCNIRFIRRNYSRSDTNIFNFRLNNIVNLMDIIDETKRNKIFDVLNKLYATEVEVTHEFNTLDKLIVLNSQKIKFPDSIKKIKYFPNNEKSLDSLPFDLKGINEYDGRNLFEVRENNDLKKLRLEAVTLMKYCRNNAKNNERIEWKETVIPNLFERLENLILTQCSNICIENPLTNVKSMIIDNCKDCVINSSSDKLEYNRLSKLNNCKVTLQINNDKQIEMKRLQTCEIVIKCKNGIKPNLKLTRCQKTSFRCENVMGNIKISNSRDISFNEGLRCESIDLFQSNIISGNIKSSIIVLSSVNKYCSIDLNEAKEIYVVGMKGFDFMDLFKNCKKFVIDSCENCLFGLETNEIEVMKVFDCEKVEIKGNVPNIKKFSTERNLNCVLPDISSTKEKDEEVIELTKDMDIRSNSKSIVIRNGKNVKCNIEIIIKSDITFEDCDNIDVILKAPLIRNLSFINCKMKKIGTTFVADIGIELKKIESLKVINTENLIFKALEIEKSVFIKNSGVDVLKYQVKRMITVTPQLNEVEIINSRFNCQTKVSAKKMVLENIEPKDIKTLSSSCDDELIMKGIGNGSFEISRPIKQIVFDNCVNLNCDQDLTGTNITLVKCSDIKLINASNSVKLEDCENIEIVTDRQQVIAPNFLIPIVQPLGDWLF